MAPRARGHGVSVRAPGPVGDWIVARSARWESLLREMVDVTSGRCDPRGLEAMRDVLRRELEALGGRPELVAGEARPDWIWPRLASDVEPLLVIRGPKRGGIRVLFCGHLDTVFDPGGPFVAMTDGSSCDAAGTDRVATGPGVIDMKGGLVSIVAILAALDAAGASAGGVDWTVALVPDEEIGSLMSARALAALAPQHDVGLVFEPCRDNGDLVLSRGGSGQCLVEATGRAVHAGREPEKGINAVDALARAIVMLGESQDFTRGIALTAGPVRGGETANIVPDSAAAWVGLRWRDAEGEESIRRAVAAVERGSPDALPWVRTRLALSRPAKPLTPQVEALGRELCELLALRGESAGIGHSGGVSDANILEGAGLPTLDGIGPRGGNMHRHDEFIRLDSLSRRAAAVGDLVAMIAARGGVAPHG